ncbi:MAG: hypothetical protein J4F36_09465 [Nitrosopumilaceae archaeon]|nr:hypothetical protein [Nitrosopumilaceae archaeon]
MNKDFLEFFQNYLSSGRAYLKWLEFTNKGPFNFDKLYLNFRKMIKDNVLDLSESSTLMYAPFYYYIHEVNNNDKYEPTKDSTDPKKIQDNKRRFRINKTGVIANLIFILELICVKKIIKSIEYGDSELATYF